MVKWASDKRKSRDPLGADVHAHDSDKPVQGWIEPRPVDAVFGGRREAITNDRCIPAPIGCGKQAREFRDDVSLREYHISGLCQECQDTVLPRDPFMAASNDECKVCHLQRCWHCKECGLKSESLRGGQCDSCYAKTLPGNYACVECGKHFHASMTGAELLDKHCFSCNFWAEKVLWEVDTEEHPFTLRIQGKHYNVGTASRHEGYGGNPFVIFRKDGMVYGTRNLWHQGTVPAHFRDRLPDNAEFVHDPGVS